MGLIASRQKGMVQEDNPDQRRFKNLRKMIDPKNIIPLEPTPKRILTRSLAQHTNQSLLRVRKIKPPSSNVLRRRLILRKLRERQLNLSELGNEIKKIPLKKETTMRKRGDKSMATSSSVKSCQNCGYSDCHQTILLCEKCDRRDWFCLACRQEKLLWAIESYLKLSNNKIQEQHVENVKAIPVQPQKMLQHVSEELTLNGTETAREMGGEPTSTALLNKSLQKCNKSGRLFNRNWQDIFSQHIQENANSFAYHCQNKVNGEELEAQVNNNYSSRDWDLFSEAHEEKPTSGQFETETVTTFSKCVNQFSAELELEDESQVESFDQQNENDQETAITDVLCQNGGFSGYLRGTARGDNNHCSCHCNIPKDTPNPSSQQTSTSRQIDQYLMNESVESQPMEASEELEIMDNMTEDNDSLAGGTWNLESNESEESETESCKKVFQSIRDYFPDIDDELEDDDRCQEVPIKKESCVKCRKSDHPDCILSCDKCFCQPHTEFDMQNASQQAEETKERQRMTGLVKVEQIVGDGRTMASAKEVYALEEDCQKRILQCDKCESSQEEPMIADTIEIEREETKNQKSNSQSLKTNKHAAVVGSIFSSAEYEAESSDIYETDTESLHTPSEQELSPESDMDDESQAVALKFARTARTEKKNCATETVISCQECFNSKNPERILLCDKCDKGYHLSCLCPELFSIPFGDWFCPLCEQAQLIGNLENMLNKLDDLLQKGSNEREVKSPKF